MQLAGGAAVAGAVAQDAPSLRAQGAVPPASAKPVFCLFSKHLPELGWSDVGRAVKDAGFDGVDLTVRAKGHVLPERAADDLPRALDAIRAHGLTVPMITTELTSAGLPSAEPILRTAAKHGVRYFKTGYNPVQVRVIGRESMTLFDGRTVPCIAVELTADTGEVLRVKAAAAASATRRDAGARLPDGCANGTLLRLRRYREVCTRWRSTSG